MRISSSIGAGEIIGDPTEAALLRYCATSPVAGTMVHVFPLGRPCNAIMTSADIPETVLQFIAEKIETVPQLEALLLLWEDPSRAWSESEIAARVYVRPDGASAIVRGLCRHQLASAEGDPPRYRYDGAWDTGKGLMSEVALAYRHNLVRLATFIHSGASPAVREFARAFHLKKDS